MGGCIGHKKPKSRSLSRNLWKDIWRRLGRIKVSPVKQVALAACVVISVVITASTATLAETLNEHVIKSTTDKAAFDRVFYTTMQTVINSNPKMVFSPPGVENSATIRALCGIGENGDTFCRTNYELYDGTDRLFASLDFHSLGKIEKTLTVTTDENHGSTALILSEDGELLFYDPRGKGNAEVFREHW
jgi:hypothetical protein